MLLISLSVGLASLQPCAATPFEWEYTGLSNGSTQAASRLPGSTTRRYSNIAASERAADGTAVAQANRTKRALE
jgi:hypothetical protein